MFVEDNDIPSRLQVLIVAPKKKLHHAVDRNRTKRILRECYRLRKSILINALQEANRSAVLSINYIDSRPAEFHKMEPVFDRLVNQLSKAFSQDIPSTQPGA